jgi:hypothetical protein
MGFPTMRLNVLNTFSLRLVIWPSWYSLVKWLTSIIGMVDLSINMINFEEYSK